MKHIITLIAISIISTSCVFKTKADKGADGEDGLLKKKITITSNEVEDIVSYLASDKLEGRNTGTEEIDLAAEYISNNFKENRVKPYFDNYLDEFSFTTRDSTSLKGFNVVGYLPGHDEKLRDEFILVGAHYDHIGFGKKIENDSIANGANDNATGTSAVMSVAKYFANAKSNKRSLVFALFSAEEMGLRGSRALAEKLKANGIDLYTVVNFEMLGVPFKDRDYEVFLTGFNESNFAEKFNSYQGTNIIGFSEVSKKYSLFRRSDNYPFYEAFKIPSHTISSCDLTNFDHYHGVGDEADIMNYEFLASVINKLIPGIEKMANTPTKEIQLNAEE